MSCSYNSLTGRSRRTQINFTVLEIAPVSGAFATKDFTFVTKICLANKGIIFGAIAEYPAHSFTFVGSLYRTRQITIGTILIQ